MGSSSISMTLLLPALLVVAMSAEALTVRPGCVDRCGNVSIPYPFGIGKDCFRGDGFEISCGKDSVPLLLGTGQNMDMRVLNLSLSPYPVARVMLPVAWQCFNSADTVINLKPDGVHRISRDHNELVALGCNTVGVLASARQPALHGMLGLHQRPQQPAGRRVLGCRLLQSRPPVGAHQHHCHAEHL
ncbi:wall-associated receptor kinase-like 8 [Lolium perenne]|uniref:wall-associated receptor kinase-like 8 n=1 Tax=Lolium perenne TaxID=4522 RepID=UPI003A9A5B9D